MPKPTGFIFYRGPSEIDGSPIVGIATIHSTNRKTGDMVQTWILPRDTEPHIAIRDGGDYAVCGDCPLRPSETGVCYVLTFQGPLAIHRAYKRGSYIPLEGNRTEIPHGNWYRRGFVEGRMVRMGAYGDPAAIPFTAWKRLLWGTKGHTGYTHQWRRFPWLRDYCQASCDSVADVREAKADGWRVFYVVPEGTDRRTLQQRTGALLHDCPAVTGRKSTTCAACGLCNGRRADIVIDAHGMGANKLPKETNT